MKDEILGQLDHPVQLEKLYRANKSLFKRSFGALYAEVKGNAIADCWNERLNYESEEINWGTANELMLVVIASLLAGFIAKLPAILRIDEAYFYTRNIGFIIFPLLTAYFGWKNKLSPGKIAFVVGATLAGIIFINVFPAATKSDTLNLSAVHLLLFLWSVLGFAFVGGPKNDEEKRLGFLKYNGDLVVMTTLILIAGAIMSGVTVGLFKLIGLNIEGFYFQNIVVIGMAAAPIVGTYLTQTNPQLVGKVSPVIAKIFSPLVLIMLVIYLIAMIYSGKNPYSDREFLMVFNALLIGVMAIIFFSIAESAQTTKSIAATWVLLLLSIVTIAVNGVALSAIVFRISEWGFTPNRVTVLGGNILILVNLLLVAANLFKAVTQKTDLYGVRKSMAFYLPVYFVWTVLVTFILPLIFGFR